MTPNLRVNMEIPDEILSFWILLLFLSFGYTCGNSVSLTSDSGQNGQPLELKCQLTLSGTYNPSTVNWYLNNYSTAIERDALNCDPVSSPSVYDLSRYTFSCKTNIFTLTIKALSLADDGNCWKCKVFFTDTTPTTTASKCVSVGQLALILGLALGLGTGCFISIFVVILICCGCLDCCKCCRNFDHYNESKCCYMTWYCLEKGCCSFFYCRPGTKRGSLFCGRKSKKERCGGCYSCQKICGCGWPGFCKSEGPRSCGDCFCICCVAGMEDEALLDSGGAVPVSQKESPANGPPTIHTGTQNKVESKPTTLPPLATKQLTLDVEPKKKKKKEKKEKQDVENNKEKTAEGKRKRMLPEGQAVPEEED